MDPDASFHGIELVGEYLYVADKTAEYVYIYMSEKCFNLKCEMV